MSTKAQVQEDTRKQQGRILYTLEAARDHCWPGNQEGPRRVDAIAKELQLRKLTPDLLSGQV